MYRTKKFNLPSKPIAVLFVFAACISIGYINFGSFWSPPNYYKDGTADSKIEAYARYGGDWIEYSQKWDGSFYYIYYSETNTYSSANNILRHAGTVYSTLLLYELTGEIRYLYVAYKGIGFLLKQLGKVDDDTYYIFFNDKVKLGGAALCLLCLTKYKELTNTHYYDDVIDKMGNYILYMQEDEGWFRSFYYYEGDYDYNWNSSIYPGEAMLALVRLYESTDEKKYLEALNDAFQFYSNDAKYQWRNMAFIPWTTSAFSEAYFITEKEEYAEFAFDMSDYVHSWQLQTDTLDDEGNNLKGGFGSTPSVNTASYMEGIGDAYRLALFLNDTDKIEVYKQSLILGAEWILSLQYRHDEIEDLKNPHRAFGGFHLSFSGEGSEDIRVDYTQHSISALIRILNTFTKKELNEIEVR